MDSKELASKVLERIDREERVIFKFPERDEIMHSITLAVLRELDEAGFVLIVGDPDD